MPMIDFTLPRDALSTEIRDRLVDDLLTTLLRWERAPENARSKSLAWAFVHVADSLIVASSPSGLPHYRVRVTTPQGALDDDRRAGLVADVTELVLRAEGSPVTPEHAFRVWVLLEEIADGSWGAEGRIWRFGDIARFVRNGDVDVTSARHQRAGAAFSS
jgi:phenylpyruvate tautomerase PptA (4-oxalocrotonate tautomerase family)